MRGNSQPGNPRTRLAALLLGFIASVPVGRADPLPTPPAPPSLPRIADPIAVAPPVAWEDGVSRFRFELSAGPAFGTQFPLHADELPSGAEVNTCGAGGSANLGFRWSGQFHGGVGTKAFGMASGIPLIGWIFFPLIPFFIIGPSGVWGNQIGADLHFTGLSYCNGQGGRYSIGLRPVFLATPTSRLRLPSFFGAILPEPILVLESGRAATFALGLLRFPVGILLNRHLGLELEPTFGYRFSFDPLVPAALTLQFSLTLVVR